MLLCIVFKFNCKNVKKKKDLFLPHHGNGPHNQVYFVHHSSLQWVMMNLTWTHPSQLPLLLRTMTQKSLFITNQMHSQPPLKGNKRKPQQQLLLKLQLSLKRSRQRAVVLMVAYVKLISMNWHAPSLKKPSQYIMLRSAVLNHSLNMLMTMIQWSRLGLRSVRVGIFELS